MLKRDDVIEAFRTGLLAALDDIAADAFGLVGVHHAGATDADLPELFAAIDAHADRLAARYGAWESGQ